MLTNFEKQSISERAEDIRVRAFREFDKDFETADLTGLINDIIIETSKKNNPLTVYDYLKLLEEQHQLFNPERAYVLGRENANAPAQSVEILCIKEMHNSMVKSKLTLRQQAMFNEICQLLGDSRGLVTELTELYRKIHGVVVFNMIAFIEMGQKVMLTEAVQH